MVIVIDAKSDTRDKILSIVANYDMYLMYK